MAVAAPVMRGQPREALVTSTLLIASILSATALVGVGWHLARRWRDTSAWLDGRFDLL